VKQVPGLDPSMLLSRKVTHPFICWFNPFDAEILSGEHSFHGNFKIQFVEFQMVGLKCQEMAGQVYLFSLIFHTEYVAGKTDW
jgi:hypothetical protein